MRALELEKGLILKERTRVVDRELNTITFVFSVKTKYGTIAASDLSKKETIVQVDIREGYNPKLWPVMKDITDVDLITFIMKNKDFIFWRDNGNKLPANDEEFKFLDPFYNTIFPYLKKFENIEELDI